MNPDLFSFSARSKGRLAPILALVGLLGCRSPEATPARPAGAFIEVGPNIPEAPDLAAILRPYRTELEARFSRVLADCPEGLNRQRPDLPLGQWITDVMRRQAAALIGSEVQVAVTNSGGLREDLPPGPILLRHVYEVFPFENTLVVGELKGSELRRFAMELAQTGEPFSGLSIRVSGPQEAPSLDRLTFADGAPVDAERTYLVATTEYLVVNGDKTPTLKTLRKVRSLSLTLRQVAIDAVESLGQKGLPLSHPPETRLWRPADWIYRRTTGERR